MLDVLTGDPRYAHRTSNRVLASASFRVSREAAGLVLCASLALLPGCASTHSAASRLFRAGWTFR
jgi:hypothetical protein